MIQSKGAHIEKNTAGHLMSRALRQTKLLSFSESEMTLIHVHNEGRKYKEALLIPKHSSIMYSRLGQKNTYSC